MNYSGPTNPDTNTASERIAMLRPLLIFLVMTTHIQGNLYRPDLKDMTLNAANFLHAALSGVIAVSALPLLSIISGYLALATLRKYNYRHIVRNKAIRLLLPMLFWNLLLGLYIYHQQASGHPIRPDLQLHPASIDWLLGLLALFKLPMNPPLYFLRELMLCFVLLPLLAAAARRWYTAIPLLMLLAWMAANRVHLYFFLRIDIYGFFLLGLCLALHQQALGPLARWLARPLNQWLCYSGFILCVSLLTLYAFLPSHKHFFLAMKVSTLLSPLVFWLLSAHLRGWLKQLLLWLSPASFTLFLAHVPLQTLTYNLWTGLSNHNPLQQGYLYYWLFTLTTSCLAAVLLTRAWHRLRKGTPHARH